MSNLLKELHQIVLKIILIKMSLLFLSLKMQILFKVLLVQLILHLIIIKIAQRVLSILFHISFFVGLEWTLSTIGVLKTELLSDPYENFKHNKTQISSSIFGGRTRGNNSDSDSDY